MRWLISLFYWPSNFKIPFSPLLILDIHHLLLTLLLSLTVFLSLYWFDPLTHVFILLYLPALFLLSVILSLSSSVVKMFSCQPANRVNLICLKTSLLFLRMGLWCNLTNISSIFIMYQVSPGNLNGCLYLILTKPPWIRLKLDKVTCPGSHTARYRWSQVWN